MEAADGVLRLVCIITDGIPSQDMMRVKRFLRRYPKKNGQWLWGQIVRELFQRAKQC